MNSSAKASARGGSSRKASATVRRNIRGTLRDLLESFLKEATDEEIWFLNDVMQTWESISLPRGGRTPEVEVYIASAFELCIEDRGGYLLVEGDKLKAAVEAFVQEVTASGGALQPRGDGWYLWKNRRNGAA
jgi:hypothetical protein